MGHHARRLADAVSDDASFIVLGFALIGAAIVVAPVGDRHADVFLVATTLAFAIVPAILFGDPRYRVPAEPFFAHPRRGAARLLPRRAHAPHRRSMSGRTSE